MSTQAVPFNGAHPDAASNSDAPFDSSPDPYDADSSDKPGSYTQLPSHIAALNLPKPWYPFPGVNEPWLHATILARYRGTEEKLNRRLTSEEQVGIAQSVARGARYGSLGPTAALGFSGYRIYKTWDGMRLPFYGNIRQAESAKPNWLLNWDGHRLKAGPAELLRSFSPGIKQGLVHILRGGNYLSLSWVFIVPLFMVYGATVSTVAESIDPRCQQLTQEMRAVNRGKAEESRMEREEELRKRGINIPKPQEGPARGKKDPTGQGEREAGDLWGRHREAVSQVDRSSTDFDDASPTGGMGMFDFEGDKANDLGSDANWEPYNQRRPSSKSVDTPQANRERREKQQRERRQARIEQSQTGGGDSGFDGGAGGESSNAWDRIRDGAMSGQSPPQSARGTSRGQQAYEGSYSGAEEEKSYAKSEAQKEFDQRLEKERRGGGFFDSGAGKR